MRAATASQSPAAQQTAPANTLLYLRTPQSDDEGSQLDLTCVAWPSRPPAKLSWFVNNTPVSALLTNSTSTSAAKWLQLDEKRVRVPQATAAASHELVEVRLRLTFRLQPHLLSHLTAPGGRTTASNSQAAAARGSQLSSLKLRCVARYGVEFVSETSVALAGGKANIKSRRRESSAAAAAMKELAASRTRPLPTASSLYSQPQVGAASDAADELSGRQEEVGKQLAANSYRWPGGRLEFDEQKVRQSSGGRGAARQLFVWTRAQLRAQAEHVEQLLRRSRPNELEPPQIEARALGFVGAANEEEADEDEALADGGEASLEGGEESVASAQPPLGSHTDSADSRSLSIKDYELNEIVQFTCTPRVGAPDQENLRRTHLKWFINDIEVSFRRRRKGQQRILTGAGGSNLI